MKTKNKTWKVIAAIGFLLLVYTMQSMAQTKPKLPYNISDYAPDGTVKFLHHSVPQSKLNDLIEIFEKADKVVNYCVQNDLPLNHGKEIGTMMLSNYIYENFKVVFTVYYKKDGFTAIKISDYPHDSYPTWVHKPNYGEFTTLLTSDRDNYYRALDKYNYQRKKISRELDDILK